MDLNDLKVYEKMKVKEWLWICCWEFKCNFVEFGVFGGLLCFLDEYDFYDLIICF